MVFLQINITNPNLNFYDLSLTNGTYTCKIIDIRYLYYRIQHPPGDQTLALISSSFNFPNSFFSLPQTFTPGTAYIFTNNIEHYVFHSGIAPSCSITISNNGLDFSILNIDTGSIPNGFKNCIVTLELTP